MNKGGTVEAAGLRVTMTTADHSAGDWNAGGETTLYLGDPVGFVIELEDGRAAVLRRRHPGVLDMTPHPRPVPTRRRVPAHRRPLHDGPGRRRRSPSSSSASDDVIPMHYGTFPVLTGTPDGAAHGARGTWPGRRHRARAGAGRQHPGCRRMTGPADPPPCIGCGAPLTRTVIDLGPTPPCEDFLTAERLTEPEVYYPLDVRICDACLLVQLPVHIPPDHIFREYAYFSSYSDSWVAARRPPRRDRHRAPGPDPGALVIEAASNDGYLLQHVQAHGLRAVGIEPARNIAEVARARGIATVDEFLSEATALAVVAEHGQADWVVANNVFAHVPAINDFTAGLATLLKPGGLLSIEVAYLVRLIAEAHSTRSITSTSRTTRSTRLGPCSPARGCASWTSRSCRRTAARSGCGSCTMPDPRPTTDRVEAIIASERALGMDRPTGTAASSARSSGSSSISWRTSWSSARPAGGSSATGRRARPTPCSTTAGSRPTSSSTSWIGTRTSTVGSRPGRIPIHPPERLLEDRPDVIVILPWNLREEITAQLTATLPWGPDLVVPIPRLEVTTLPRHGTE